MLLVESLLAATISLPSAIIVFAWGCGLGVANMERSEASIESQEDRKPQQESLSQRVMDEMRSCSLLNGSLGPSLHRDQDGGQARVMCNVVDSVGGVSSVLPPVHLIGDGTGRPSREGHGRF